MAFAFNLLHQMLNDRVNKGGSDLWQIHAQRYEYFSFLYPNLIVQTKATHLHLQTQCPGLLLVTCLTSELSLCVA